MKTKRVSLKIAVVLLMLVLFVPGCVVLSFYPLYEKDDLFNNELLTGRWIDEDSTIWNFNHPQKKHKGEKVVSDSALYNLRLRYNHDIDDQSKFEVGLIKLADNYYMDLYLSDYSPQGKDQNLLMTDLHMMPVHTFAKLTHWDDSMRIQWLDPDWLKKQFDENRIRIRHENNGSNILLTASPKEIQKFLLKYGQDEEIFELNMTLYKIDDE